MKKQFLFMVVLLLMVSTSQAQDLAFGAMGGLNINIVSQNIDPDQPGIDEESSSGFGFHLGGFGTYALSEELKL
ncbi:MAG: hypothetical protein NWS86_09240, partial [Flavobacteriales bacterium]|nr:hypothetical protein [Flavobacteriales bacterium]